MARTILVVEDEPTLRETLADALGGEGFRVVVAADGRAALERFRAEQPDLVLLDLMLPELSGIDVCRIIRAESAVPIVTSQRGKNPPCPCVPAIVPLTRAIGSRCRYFCWNAG